MFWAGVVDYVSNAEVGIDKSDVINRYNSCVDGGHGEAHFNTIKNVFGLSWTFFFVPQISEIVTVNRTVCCICMGNKGQIRASSDKVWLSLHFGKK